MKSHPAYVEATTTSSPRAVDVSVIIPVTSRHDDLTEIYRTHADVLRRSDRSFEFIIVSDAGFETAVSPLRALQRLGEPIRVLQLPRKFGEATALMIGFERARAEAIVTLPAYLQSDPEGVAEILEALDKGADMVVASRTNREDALLNRLQHRVFNALTNRLTGMSFTDIGCSLRAMRRSVTRELRLYGNLHGYLPLLAYQRGFRVEERPVGQHVRDTRPRLFGPRVYVNCLLDIMTVAFLSKFTRKPLRFFGMIGSGLFAGGFLLSLILAAQRLLGGTPLADRPLLLLGVLLMVLGVQVASIGLLGEIIVFTHARRMKDYTIEMILD